VTLDCDLLCEVQILRWVAPTQAYVFTHALIQDVAYESMTRADRSARHLDVARALERAFGPHRYRARDAGIPPRRGGDPERTVHYLRRAARLALARSANREAVSLFQRAVQILEPQPDKADEELDVRIELGPPLIATSGYSSPAVEANYERALEVSRRLQDAERSFHALNGMRRFHQVRGGPARCAAIVDELLGRASGTGDPYLLGAAELAAGETSVLAGRPGQGLDHLRKAESLLGEAFAAGRAESRDYWITARAYQALALWFGESRTEARAATTSAAERARELDSPYGLVYSLVLRAWVNQLDSQPEAVTEDAQEANRLAIEHGFAYWEVASRCLEGWAEAVQGNREALAKLESAVGDYVVAGARTAETWLFSLLAEARMAHGDTTGASDALDHAARSRGRTGGALHGRRDRSPLGPRVSRPVGRNHQSEVSS
jgi:predicted ATPase